jgi:hypothetical protein
MSEPVAWMDYLEHSDVYDLNVSGRGIPLYTHPAKTLTDEEIHELANKHLRTQNQDGTKVVLGLEDFAKALMEKMRNE